MSWKIYSVFHIKQFADLRAHGMHCSMTKLCIKCRAGVFCLSFFLGGGRGLPVCYCCCYHFWLFALCGDVIAHLFT